MTGFCETWIMIAFLGWTPPLQVGGFLTEDACHKSGKQAENYCTKRDNEPCTPKHYCLAGPPVPCNPVQ
jgi:hypothetical protein